MSGRILVVDDDDAIRTMEVRILTASGFEVEAVADGAAALELAESRPFDLVLLDVMMPGLSGFEVARELRRRERTRNVPILFASARGEPDLVDEGFEAGASLYLVKPFTTTTLLTMVRTAMATAR